MSKRKADEQNPRIFSIQQELTKCTTSINEGTYPALVQINDSLLGAKQRRQSMADKHRKMQIKNINDLYDYELRDIHSQYMDAYEAAQARLKQELQEEAIRLEAQRQAAAAAAAAEAKEKEKELRIAAETEENAGADTYRTNVNVNEGAEAEQRTTMGSPHLHLNTVIQVQAQARSRSGSISSVTGGTGAGGTRKKEATGTAKKARSTTPLTFALPEGAMRSDFRDIVDDLHARANFFAKTAPMPNAAVRILFSDAQGCFHLCIGSKVYVAGDLVTVFSVLSQETFSGVITAVSDDEVSIRCGSGLCIAVYLRQLLEGRVVISKDEDSYTMHNIMQASAEMAKRRNLNQEQVVEVDV